MTPCRELCIQFFILSITRPEQRTGYRGDGQRMNKLLLTLLLAAITIPCVAQEVPWDTEVWDVRLITDQFTNETWSWVNNIEDTDFRLQCMKGVETISFSTVLMSGPFTLEARFDNGPIVEFQMGEKLDRLSCGFEAPVELMDQMMNAHFTAFRYWYNFASFTEPRPFTRGLDTSGLKEAVTIVREHGCSAGWEGDLLE